ncbi:MAG: type II toxin-antitoxin system death-on-curing family toxin [Rhodothermales bacterium]
MTPLMPEPKWIERAWVSAIHADQVKQYGGSLGIRDEGMIESALMRPRQRRAYERSCDLATLCAAYGFGLTKNHGFVDGNKRIAFQVMYVLLGLNGMRLVAEEVEVVQVMLDVAAGTFSEEALAGWIRNHIEPR